MLDQVATILLACGPEMHCSANQLLLAGCAGFLLLVLLWLVL
jgi:hypothetical protein